MAKLDIKWKQFTVVKKHDVDRDKPYLWVFGIVLDADTVKSRQFVIRKPATSASLGDKKFKKGDSTAVPSTLDISKEINPYLGLEMAGVVVLAWENATTRDSLIATAYMAAANLINNYINELVTEALDDIFAGKDPSEIDAEVSAADIECLEMDLAKTVRNIIRGGSGLFQAIPDHDIGSAYFLTKVSEPVEQCLCFTFTKKTTHYELEGDMTYDIPVRPGRLPDSIPPKHQEPKPQAQARRR